MRNQQQQQQQQESGNRYQFRLHPVATTTIDEEQQQQQQQLNHQHHHQQQQQLNNNNKHNNNNNNNNSNNKNININNKDNNNKCVKTQMSVSMKSLTSSLVGCGGGGSATLKDATTTILHRKQFTTSSSDAASNASFSSASMAGSIPDDMSDQCSLTQAGLEEYNIRSSSYYDQPALFHHQKQSSYAQSEGYHSYVSSSDSSSATPFLDRLRQESELLSRQSHHWSQNDLSSVSCHSVAPSPTPLLQTNGRDGGEAGKTSDSGGGVDHQQPKQQNNSSESTSSTETLKWLGSMSDISEASHVTGYSAISESVSSSQLIVHSSRVRTPKRHHSESVLYLNNELQQPQHDPHHESHHHQQTQQQQQQLHSSYPSPTQISPTLSGRDLSPTASLSSLRLSPNHRHSPSYPPLHVAHMHSLHALHPLSPAIGRLETSSGLPNSSLVAATPNSSHSSCSSVASSLPTTPPSSSSSPSSTSDSLQNKSSISATISSNDPVQSAPPLVSSQAMAGSDLATKIVGSPTTATATTLSPTTPLTIVTSSAAAPIATTDAAAAAVSTLSAVSSSSSSSSSSTTSAPSPSAGSLMTSYRSNHRLFPVSTYTEPVHSNTSQYVQHPKPQFSSGLQKPALQQQKKLAPASHQHQPQSQQLNQSAIQPSWQSVSELINDFERSNELQPQKYSYIDPSKTHRVSNPALKAFQKNAVQSYFERQQQQQHSKEHNQHKFYQLHISQQLLQQQQQMMRPHSFQSTVASKEFADQAVLRNSLPNAFGTSSTTPTYEQPLSSSPSAPQVRHTALKDYAKSSFDGSHPAVHKPPSPAPPPPPPRTRSLMPTLLRRSSSASDCAEFRDQFMRASQEKLQAQSVKNISSSEKSSFNDCGMPPPPPPPRGRASLPVRRTSSATEYAAMRDMVLQQQAAALAQNRTQRAAPHQYYSPAAAPPLPPPATHAAHPDPWVPERPPKNPSLRIPSPELPPPPAEVDSGLSDEPLPPPPPEILHRQPYYEPAAAPPTFLLGGEFLPKPLSQNRRNSFAGSSTRKPPTSLFNRSTSEQVAHPTIAPPPPPPTIPKKPSSMELLQASRPASSMAQQCNKAHKVLLNGSNSSPQQQHQQYQQHQNNSSPPPLPAMCKINVNRKRPHNPASLSNIPPIMENTVSPSQPCKPAAAISAAAATSKCGPKVSPPPPPLKPRMSITNQGAVHAISSNLRCNSKASYLPRQSLEKLNNSDPDHGSYKLTLTSNEDLVGHTKPAYDILAHNGKLPSNLPDVLPLGAKLQPQPTSPTTASGGATLRYSSGANLSAANIIASAPQAAAGYPHLYPTQHRYSTPAMSTAKNYYNHSNANNNNNHNNNNHTANYSRSQSCDVNSNSCFTNPTKYMSQSALDLKKTHNLETTLEETTVSTSLADNSQLLSPAQSENNLSSSSYNHNNKQSSPSTTKSPSPYTARREFHRSDMVRTLSLEERTDSAEGRIVRAELVNTTLAISPCNTTASGKASVTRKDSLRENIEKITQLQSQLMSAHLSDSGLLNNYGVASKSACNQVPARPEGAERKTLPSPPNEELPSDQTIEPNNHPSHSNDSASTPRKPVPSPDTLSPQSAPQPGTECDSVNEVVMAQISQMDCNTDGLKLMQRSEIILRVNPLTVEAASQTDDMADGDMRRLTESHQHNKEDAQTSTTLQPRKRHPIETDCDLLSRELAKLLAPNDKLITVLTPSVVKSPADYVSNLYNPNVPHRPTKRDVGTSTLMRMKSQRETLNEVAAEKSSVVTVELQYAEINGNGPDSCDMLKRKVDELIQQLNCKLMVLNKEQATIGEESAINDELGSGLVEKLSDKVRPLESTKFRTYIDDVGHITSLLLSLSERLAKTENNLSTIDDPENAEKKTLETKRDRLLEQLEEAKRLKEDIERRGGSLTGMLRKHLTADEFADFDYFINMKAKLIADGRDLADKIKSGEEQLNALSEALMQSDC